MQKTILLWCILLLGSLIQAQSFSSDSLAVVAVLKQQEIAWNAHDIDAFMEGYWKSPKLVFCGASGPVYGWEATKTRYKKSYNTPEKMGVLTFTILDLQAFSSEVIQLIGRFELERKPENASGYFTLLWHRVSGEWKIVSDHTSASSSQKSK